MNPEKIDLLLEIQNRQMLALERIATVLERLAPTNQSAPNYQRPLEQFAQFDWASVGAEVERKDQHGAAIVNWNGQQFVRRSPSNKFGAAVWFSRCVGKNEENENVYERLITFKPISDRDVEPLPDKVAARISNGQQPRPQAPVQQPPLAQTPGQSQTQPRQHPKPQPQTGANAISPYPQHNGVIKAIRSLTGHDPQAILDWCRANGAPRPDQLRPDQLPALVEWLALSWAIAHTGIPLEGLRNSYRGRVATMTASGQSLSEAATGWLGAQQERLASK